jgi:hypothetical protein
MRATQVTLAPSLGRYAVPGFSVFEQVPTGWPAFAGHDNFGVARKSLKTERMIVVAGPREPV